MVDAELRPRLIEYIGGIVCSLDGKLIRAGGPADHLHLAVSMASQPSVADLVRDVKANSSKWIHQTFDNMGDFAWQDGYAAFSVSHSGMGRVMDYIRQQDEHHRRLSFDEELIALLKRHEVVFDERYIVA